MYAHLIRQTVACVKLILVVITDDVVMAPYQSYEAIMVASLDEAFKLAEKHNAELLEDGKTMLQGEFQ